MKIDTFRLERYFARYEFQVSHLLCASDCESLSVAELLEMEPGAEEGLRKLWLGYTESPGDPALRQEIAGLYERTGPDRVLVHTGAEEAIFNFCNAVLEPGDEVIVHWPCYQSLFEVGRAVGCRMIPWKAREEEGWRLDLDRLAGLVSDKTRALIVNLPHNPTGFLMDRSEFSELVAMSEQKGFLLFCDEVYRGLEPDPGQRLPAACDRTENAVSLGVMSKTYGLAGLRIGWVATRNSGVLEAMSKFKDYTTICNSAPSEFLAGLALRQRDRIVARNLEIIGNNLTLLDGFFRDWGGVFSWQRPRAGSIALPSLIGRNADEFCAELVERTGVLLAPGSMFAPELKSNFRIGYGRADLVQCLDRLVGYLEKTRAYTLA